MNRYNRVLLAIDFHDDCQTVIDRGLQVVADNDAELFLQHVMEPITVAYSIEAVGFADQMVEMKQTIRENSAKQLQHFGEQLGVPAERRLHSEGIAADEIHRMAKEHNIELIIIGTHGQSGLRSLLGSTANSVLHNVECDVLMVRL
ncbi:universal stress protein [Ferrimonas lipolytica]|uniref:Universal stress protein n=1 Tax=Ferrimonas lipolytica TaxID=2724191 RepID=A0A6H1UIU8_9GAMM|nr:universal stress protein [Ferrimonas lipolytica]QIZ77722.1 universal stress protein [Ferrimonas lipolytica]